MLLMGEECDGMRVKAVLGGVGEGEQGNVTIALTRVETILSAFSYMWEARLDFKHFLL
jgi:hypothetical protein